MNLRVVMHATKREQSDLWKTIPKECYCVGRWFVCRRNTAGLPRPKQVVFFGDPQTKPLAIQGLTPRKRNGAWNTRPLGTGYQVVSPHDQNLWVPITLFCCICRWVYHSMLGTSLLVSLQSTLATMTTKDQSTHWWALGIRLRHRTFVKTPPPLEDRICARGAVRENFDRYSGRVTNLKPDTLSAEQNISCWIFCVSSTLCSEFCSSINRSCFKITIVRPTNLN